MKKILFPAIITLFIILSSCSKESINQPENNGQKSGKISFSIDKVNAPKEVVKITAYLTRQGYQTIQSGMNLSNDSTADLTMSDVAVGIWHLKVDAENSEEKIIYSGETDVEVLEGTTIQVSLTLIPTGEATGSINIFVTWSSKSDKWLDFAGNPIFTNLQSPGYPPYGVGPVKVLFADGKFKMWYGNQYNSGVADVGYAESIDGISWNSYQTSVLTNGGYGTWDEYSSAIGAVIKDENSYKMYYTGWNNSDTSRNIGLATSLDGIHWEKYPVPVLLAGEEVRIQSTDLLKVNGTYYLYYNFRKYPELEYGLCLATSTDGINWTKDSGNPLLTVSQSWEGPNIYSATVIYENNKFIMFYMNADLNGIGMAISSDGKHWVKSGRNPVFTPENLYSDWSDYVYYPFLRKFGDHYRLYYCGRNYSGDTKVALAMSKSINF